MTRIYLVFGSDDGINWEQLKPVGAGGAPQALNAARRQQSYRHYAAVAEGNWTVKTPEVEERDPIVRWKPFTSDQLSVEDVLKES